VLLPALALIYAIAVHRFILFFPLTFVLLSILMLLLLYKQKRKGSLIIASVFIVALIYCFIRHPTTLETPPIGRGIHIKGTIADLPEMKDGRLLFTLRDVFLNGKGIKGMLSLSMDTHRRPILLRSGEIVDAIASLKGVSTSRNPGIYSHDLREDGIVGWGSVSEIKVIGSDDALIHRINRTRQELGGIIDNSLSPDAASFLKAIIIGLRRGIREDIINDFNSTGLGHLLSISGTHFGLLAFIIFKSARTVIRAIPLRILNRLTLYLSLTQINVLLTMPFLIFYLGISGASIPSVRSFIMVSIYMIALFIGRGTQWLNSLSISAIIILLWSPSALFDVSFQLSFLAVLSIGLALERMKVDEHEMNIIKRSFKKMKTAWFITTSAVVGTAPLIILYFKQLPLISPVTNLIITPLVCFMILPIGFISSLIAIVLGMPSLPFGHIIDSLTKTTLNTISLFADIPYVNIHLPDPSFIMIVLYLASMLLIVTTRDRWRVFPALVVILFFLLRAYIPTHEMRIAFLDVNQGDSSVIELPDGKVMLIDGGPESNDSGRRIVAPYLWSRGINRIDVVVLTHPHPDHYGGLIYILDSMDVKEVWWNGRFIAGSEPFFNRLSEKGILLRIPRRGDSFKGKDYKITVLHPYDSFYSDSQRGYFSNENNDSLVLKIESGDTSLLFTGDIEIEAEEDLLYLGSILKSDIIKVPHHGGRTSSSEEFIAAVNPSIAIISVGRYNPYNHPHNETINRYLSRHVRLYRTDNDGAVIVTIDDNRYSITTYEERRFKKVSSLYDEVRNIALIL